MRVGVVGWSSHVEEFHRFAPDVDLLAARHPDTPHGCRGTIEDLVPHAPEIDGVLIMDRNPQHRVAQVVPLLEAGLRVFVDKPFALSVKDADAMVGVAPPGHLTSFSALRWLPATIRLGDLLAHLPTPRRIRVSGPADPGDKHSGLAFYGIHVIELALHLLQGHVHDVRVAAPHKRTVRLGVTTDRGSAEVVLGPPGAPFLVSIDDETGRPHVITLDRDYYRPATKHILAFLAGAPSLDTEAIREPIVVLQAALDSIHWPLDGLNPPSRSKLRQ